MLVWCKGAISHAMSMRHAFAPFHVFSFHIPHFLHHQIWHKQKQQNNNWRIMMEAGEVTSNTQLDVLHNFIEYYALKANLVYQVCLTQFLIWKPILLDGPSVRILPVAFWHNTGNILEESQLDQLSKRKCFSLSLPTTLVCTKWAMSFVMLFV